MSKNIAIILAAGEGKRLGYSIPKQFIKIFSKEILAYTIEKFEKSNIEEILIITNEKNIKKTEKIVQKYQYKKIKKIIVGGKERYNSVYNAISEYSFENEDKIFIHDAARCLISVEKINELIRFSQNENAVVLGVKAIDTLRTLQKDEFYNKTLDRNIVYNIQTPQVFVFDKIKKAYDIFMKDDKNKKVTDDAEILYKYLKIKAKFLEGEYKNIKITNKDDLIIVKAFIREERGKVDE